MVQLLISLLTVFAAFFLDLIFVLSLLHLFPLSFCLSPSRTALDYLTVLLCVTFSVLSVNKNQIGFLPLPSPLPFTILAHYDLTLFFLFVFLILTID